MSAFGDSISRYIPITRRKPKLDRQQALAVIPVRNPLITWEWKDKEIMLTVPMRDDLIARTVKRLLPKLP